MTLAANPERLLLSVVMPVYNEAARAPASLAQIFTFLESRRESFEVIVVDDGSTDATLERLRSVCRERRNVRILRFETNHGKGAAVRAGVLSASGMFVLFTDADLSAPIADAERLLAALREGYDVALGSRALRREWITIRQPWWREAGGRALNWVLRRITGLPFRDTQCGFKGFRRPAAQHIFSRLTVPRFGFDVEVLYLARRFGYRSVEVPVHWADSEGTKVRPLRDGARMFLDLLKIRWNDWNGKYSAAPAGTRLVWVEETQKDTPLAMPSTTSRTR